MDTSWFSTPLACALVAVIGYWWGHRTRDRSRHEVDAARRELKRAKAVAHELENIAESVRKNLANHHSSIAHFKGRVQELTGHAKEPAWQELCKEAEEMLKPTLRLAAQLAHAYDEIRQQSNHLMTFAEIRTDPLTRVSNRRALDETLTSMFALLNRYDQMFSLAIFDIDHFKNINDQQGHLEGDRILQDVARILDEAVRDTDIVARYGGEEFVVVMPHTLLDGAMIFADRVRKKVQECLQVTISGGVATAAEADSPVTLLNRADAALYAAKAANRNCVYVHDGREIQPLSALLPVAAS